MFVSKNEPKINVPVSEGTVFTVQSAAGVERRVAMENLDAANTMTWRFQYSDDNSTWTDEATDTTLAPGARIAEELTGHVFYRLRASGNLDIAVQINAEFDLVGSTFSFHNV